MEQIRALQGRRYDCGRGYLGRRRFYRGSYVYTGSYHGIGQLDVTAGEYRLLIAGDAIWGGYSEKIGSNEEAWFETLDKNNSQTL